MAKSPSLPSTSSVVDYLSTRKKDSSFSARKKLYDTSGLSRTLGEYTGSSNQNLAFLKYLQTQEQKPAVDTAPVSANKGLAASATSAIFNPARPASSIQAAQQSPLSASALTRGQFGAPTMSLASNPILQSAMAAPKAPTASNIFGTPEAAFQAGLGRSPLTSALQLGVKAPAPAVSASQVIAPRGGGGSASASQSYTQRDQQTAQQTGGVSASSLFPELADSEESASESDLINDWINSAEGQQFLKRQNDEMTGELAKTEALKQELEMKYAAEKATLEQKLAANGLAISGIRASAVKALADGLAASMLGADRELASKLLDANNDLTDAILDGVAEIVKDTQDADDARRKEAIQQLNSLGYAVVDGQLVPNLAMRTADRADAAAERSERQLQISEARLSLAEAAASRAEARFVNEQNGDQDGFDYVRQLMELNPNASRAEIKAAALEHTKLGTGEVDAILDTMPLAPNQMLSAAKALVASNFGGGAGVFKTVGGDLKKAKDTARSLVAGGVLKVGGRVVSLDQDMINTLNGIIDTVTAEEANATKDLLK